MGANRQAMYGNNQSRFASDCYLERVPVVRKRPLERGKKKIKKAVREAKKREAVGGRRAQSEGVYGRKKRWSQRRKGGKKDERMKQHIEETDPRCSYLKINLPRDGTTSF